MLPSAFTPSSRETKFETGQVMIARIDQAGRFTDANEGFLQGRGLSSRELLGRTYETLSHPEMPACIYVGIWEKLRSGEDVFAYLLTTTKQGERIWELAYLAPNYDAQGRSDGYLVTHRRADPGEIAQIEPFYRKIRKLESHDPDAAPQQDKADAIAHAA